MCKSFSGIIDRKGKVTWKFDTDSHEELEKLYDGWKGEPEERTKVLARFEISPKNKDYLKPDEWVFKIDEDRKPAWWTEKHEKNAWSAFKPWKKKFDSVLVCKPIVNPFKIEAPEITERHIALLKEWYSVGDSVRYSVSASVWASVRASVGDSVGDSVSASVGASVWAYVGSFFKLKRKEWKHTEKIKSKGYPFQSAVDLWNDGLVPSFDGKTWKLHGLKDGKVQILFKIGKEDLKEKKKNVKDVVRKGKERALG